MRHSYADRTIVVGEAAGQLKAVTCGGIYYGILAAEIAAETLNVALNRNLHDSAALSIYEKRWRKLLDKELKAGMRIRSAFEKFSDSRIETLFEIACRDGLMSLIREKANFDWHRELIGEVLRHSLTSALFRPYRFARMAL
jgi:flavin-dependent dehydrogenase